MNHDFYAEFWDEKVLMNCFNNEFEDKWKETKNDRNIKPKDKPKKLCNKLKSETEFYNKLVNNFLKGDHNFCPTLYQKFQKILQEFINVNTDELRNQIHSILENPTNGIRNYNKRDRRNPVNKLDLSENPKKAYKKFIHPEKNKWLGVPKKTFELMESLNIKFKENEFPNLSHLPSHSFFLSITFTLKKPFISKDDEEFYIHENPVSKEKVFKVPYVRASSWKGNLRWAVRKILENNTNKKEMEERLFGNEKGDEKNLKRGRLQFYPTFFNMIGLDIINPHDRETRAGTVPITLEVVPENAEGTFSLLYVPFDLIGEDENKVKNEVKQDLKIICEAVEKLLTVYGFSAKKTSGYGVVNPKFKEGFFDIKGVELKNKKFENFNEFYALVKNVKEKLEVEN